MHTFIPDDDTDSITIQADLSQPEELNKLDLLIKELRQERCELKNELADFMQKHGDTKEGEEDLSVFEERRDAEEMQDDIEYLTGENKELQMKVKDVCH